MSLTSYRAAPSRDTYTQGALIPQCSVAKFNRTRVGLEFIKFGNDLLSHVLRRSTIGAAALNCRVRDGVGCFARAMITKPKKL